MKFLCDVHIPIRLSKRIAELGFKYDHVNNILDGFHTKDTDIATHCNQNQLVLITKDRDFKNSFLLKQKPARLIKVNLGNTSNSRLINLVEENMRQFVKIHNTTEAFMIELETDGSLTITK